MRCLRLYCAVSDTNGKEHLHQATDARRQRLHVEVLRGPDALFRHLANTMCESDISRPDNVLEAILELVELGLVNELPGDTPAMPVYKLTAEGQRRL